MQPTVRPRPVAIFLSTLAYFYNTVNNVVVPLRGRTNDNETFVETNYGILKGYQDVSRIGRNYYVFRGIRYASPPVGSLRYEPPIPTEKWDGIRDATRYGSQCLQMNIITRRNVVGSEDCLFLNVFSHKVFKNRTNADEASADNLSPVMVYVHGGLFMNGGSNMYREKYFMDEDVVLVTINYRLASFGFLNTGDGKGPLGNMGLKDQTMALRWIKENIKYFGGDSTRVTLMGESAGAASVHYHTLSPLSKGLFHRVISMSGTALSPWALITHPEAQAKEYAEDLGCPREPTEFMVRCLKSIDSHTIARYHFGYINGLADQKQSIFGPTVEILLNENTFLSATPTELMQTGNITPVPWMNGVNADEGLVYMIPIIRNSTLNKLINTKWDFWGPRFLQLPDSTPNKTYVAYAARKYYLNNSDIGLPTLKQAANMLSDRAFFLDSHDSGVFHSKVAPMYSYFYNYSGQFASAKLLFVKSPFPFQLPDRLDFAIGGGLSWFAEYILRIKEPNYFGIAHSDEIPLFFNVPFIRREVLPLDDDYSFSRKLVKLWTSFATYGFPNSLAINGPRWTPVTPNSNGTQPLRRLHLNKEFTLIPEPFFKRLQFWKSNNISYVF